MRSTGWNDAETKALFRAILRLQTVSEAARFFRDLMTEQELLEMRNRWLAVRLLDQGVSYKTIEARTGMSSRTLARISRWIRDGEGGYPMMLKRMGKDEANKDRAGRSARSEE